MIEQQQQQQRRQQQQQQQQPLPPPQLIITRPTPQLDVRQIPSLRQNTLETSGVFPTSTIIHHAAPVESPVVGSLHHSGSGTFKSGGLSLDGGQAGLDLQVNPFAASNTVTLRAIHTNSGLCQQSQPQPQLQSQPSYTQVCASLRPSSFRIRICYCRETPSCIADKSFTNIPSLSSQSNPVNCLHCRLLLESLAYPPSPPSRHMLGACLDLHRRRLQSEIA